MIITLKNTTKRMRLYQIGHQFSAGAYKSRSENVIRMKHRADGSVEVRRVRLRHGPVLRLLPGQEKEIPIALMHDPQLKRDTKGTRPPLKIVKRESLESNLARRNAAAHKAANVTPKDAAPPVVTKPKKTKTTRGKRRN